MYVRARVLHSKPSPNANRTEQRVRRVESSVGLFVVMALSSGLGFYNHAVLIQALAQTGNFSVTSASSAVSLFFIVSGLTGLVVAPILERVDARWIICAGAMISALGLALLSSVSTLFELYIVYFLFGVGFCASGLLPATTLIARWFVVYRARALSIASTGLSVGGMLITPLSAEWVASMDMVQQPNSWRSFTRWA